MTEDERSSRKATIKAEMQARDAHLRESWVKAMETRLVREELDKCHRAEGVNHYENCKWLTEKYISMLKDSKVKGFKVVDV